MQRNLLLELLEDGEHVSLYSPKFEGEEMTEFEKFIMEYQTSHLSDLQQIVHRLDMIKQYGAADTSVMKAKCTTVLRDFHRIWRLLI